MELKQIGFKIENSYLKTFMETKKSRKIKKDVNYFRHLIKQDKKIFENEKPENEKTFQLLKRVNEYLEILNENFDSQKTKNNTSQDITYSKTLEGILIKILSILISLEANEIKKDDFYEVGIGDEAAKKIIEKIKKGEGE